MKTKKIFLIFMMAIPTIICANQNFKISHNNTTKHECVNNNICKDQICPKCGKGKLTQCSKVVNRHDQSRKCTVCNGTGKQGRIINGKIRYDGPDCKACNGTGHPYKQVIVYYLKCFTCKAEYN